MNITYNNLNKAIAHIHSAKRDILAYKKSLEVFHLLSLRLKTEKAHINEVRSQFASNVVAAISDQTEDNTHDELLGIAAESIEDIAEGYQVEEKIDRQISETQKAREHINHLMKQRNYDLAHFRDIILSSVLNDLEDNAPSFDNLHKLLDDLIEGAQMILDTDFDAQCFALASDLVSHKDFHLIFNNLHKYKNF